MKYINLILSISLLSFFSACQTTSSTGTRTQTGAAIGSASGAILGAIIGHQSGETGEGALIGAAAGGLLGGVMGNAQDKSIQQSEAEREMERQRMIQEAQIRQQQAETNRKDMIRMGASIDDPDILAARQAAEKAEAEVARLKQEQAEALRRAKEIEEYKAREQAARRKQKSFVVSNTLSSKRQRIRAEICSNFSDFRTNSLDKFRVRSFTLSF